MTRWTAMLLFSVLASGCVEPPEPNWLYQGGWIDVEGRGRSADQTCKGTFDYLDRYAEALSMEYGADEHLGIYRWYSNERFEAEEPCGEGWDRMACATYGGTKSKSILLDHELVHMARMAVLPEGCPPLFEEGLATYYSTSGRTPSPDDIELLAKRFDALGGRLPSAEYDIAGRFMGFLVRQFGLDAVLEVCRINGLQRDRETLTWAMNTVLGASPEELLAEFVEEPYCGSWSNYQSRVLVCGEAGAARSAGVVDEELLLRYRMGCGEESTVGPGEGRIRIIERIEFLHSGPHFVSMDDAEGKTPPVELIVAPCEPCNQTWPFMAGDAFGPLQIDAGTYWLEMRADKDFTGEFTLRFTKD